jgi:transcriptional regulator of aromatic amino acid metabolism
MTVYLSIRKEFFHLLKPLIPDSVKILYRAAFSLSDFNKTDADFIVTEIDLLEDYENYIHYPHNRMVLLGGENRELDKIAPLLEKSAKYFSSAKMDEALCYLYQRYHYEKTSRDSLISNDRFKRIIGISKMICQVKHEIEQYAPYEETVTILGESGTGKELVARALHEHSNQ